jgi:Ca2+-binding RTX toxin-like protein
MTTHTVYGIRVSGDVTQGALTYEGTARFRFFVPEDFLFSFTYSNPATDGTFTNPFGIPELDDSSTDYGTSGFGALDGGAEIDEAYYYQLNYTGGGTTHLFELYNEATDITYLFAVGGTVTNLPSSQAGLDDVVSQVNASNPASTLSLPPTSPADWSNSFSSENDLVFDIAGNSETFDFGIGNDSLYVGDGDDIAFGRAGNDRIVATGGENQFFGGEGNDVMKFRGDAFGEMFGEGGDDKLIGGSGNDQLDGGSGSDIVIGLSGEDELEGSDGNDFLYGGRDNDIVSGDQGNDVVRGNLGNDQVYGNEGSDRIYGGGSNDQLFGGDGRDFLLGENGNDVLDGGTGNDNMTGGAGRDMFIFATGGGFDQILDFEDGLDSINLFDTGVSSFGDLNISAAGGGASTRIDFGGGDVLFLSGVTTAQVDSSDFIFAIG